LNEKMSKILGSQAGQLIRLGIYTALVLALFAAFLSLLGMEIKKEQARPDKEKSIAESAPVAAADIPEAEEHPGKIANEAAAQGVGAGKAAAPDDAAKEADASHGAKGEKTVSSVSAQQVKNRPVKTAQAVPAVKTENSKWPARGSIIRHFGLSYSQTFSDYRFHKGVDIELERGAEVAAILGGKVTAAASSKGEAGVVTIDHGSGWQTLYAHLNEIYVKTGETVKQGQPLGSVDQPGLNEILEGPHLHFELHKDGQEVNPLDYLPE
jgi:murein DD-endopeptidase MepM/ murein hydrolase activator NlpD